LSLFASVVYPAPEPMRAWQWTAARRRTDATAAGSGARSGASTAFTVAAFLYFAAVVLWSAPSSPFHQDPALHATVAKNVAEGRGWVMSYPPGNAFVETTTGPALVLSGALMVALFGSTIWVPPVTTALWNLTLLGIFLYRVARLVRSGAMLVSITLGLCAAYLFFDGQWWTTFVGEVPCFLLFLIACTLAVDRRIGSERRRFLLLGLVAGLCVNVRVLSLPGFAGIGGYLLVQALSDIRRGAVTWRAFLANVLVGAAGVAVLVVPVRIAEVLLYVYYGGSSVAEFMAQNQDWYLSNNAMGVGALLASPDILGSLGRNLVLNAQHLTGVLATHGIGVVAQAVGALATVVLSLRLVAEDDTEYGRLVAVLGCGVVGYALWFFPLSLSLFDRYTLHPVLILTTFVVLTTAWWLPRAGVPALLVGVALAAPAPRVDVTADLLRFREPDWIDRQRLPGEAHEYFAGWQSRGWGADGGPGRRPPRLVRGHAALPSYNEMVLEAAAFVAGRQFRYPLANCGWMATTRELEFVLPGVEHFEDCYELIEDALRPIEPAPTGMWAPAYTWTHPVNFTLVVQKMNWQMATSYRPDRVRQAVLDAACGPPLFETPLYRVVECEFDALRAKVPLNAKTPFVGSPPIWNRSAQRRLGIL